MPMKCEREKKHMLAGASSSTAAASGPRGVLVAAWVVGDVAKTVYFVMTGSPVQFLVCGAPEQAPEEGAAKAGCMGQMPVTLAAAYHPPGEIVLLGR